MHGKKSEPRVHVNRRSSFENIPVRRFQYIHRDLWQSIYKQYIQLNRQFKIQQVHFISVIRPFVIPGATLSKSARRFELQPERQVSLAALIRD